MSSAYGAWHWSPIWIWRSAALKDTLAAALKDMLDIVLKDTLDIEECCVEKYAGYCVGTYAGDREALRWNICLTLRLYAGYRNALR